MDKRLSELLKDYDPQKNSNLDLQKLSPGSKKRINWCCHICGHKWSTPFHARMRDGKNCRNCYENTRTENVDYKASVGFKFSELKHFLSRFNENKNIDFDHVPTKTNRKVTYYCPSCEKKHIVTVSKLYSKPICESCHTLLVAKPTSLLEKRKYIAQYWDYAENPVDVHPGSIDNSSNKKYKFKCMKCGKSVYKSPNKLNNLVLCDECNIKCHTSFPEAAIYFYLRKMFPDAKQQDRSNGKEIDIYLPNLNCGIEYNSYTYHSKHKDKDIKKIEYFSHRNIQIYPVTENFTYESYTGKTFYVPPHPESNDLNILIDELCTFLSELSTLDSELEKPDINIEHDRTEINNLLFTNKPTLYEKNPELLKEWDPENDIDPKTINYNSTKIAKWICPKGHKYVTMIYNRSVKKTRCKVCTGREFRPKENSLQAYFPDFINNCWDFEANDKLGIKPDSIHKSFKKIKLNFNIGGIKQLLTVPDAIKKYERLEKRKMKKQIQKTV